MEFKDPPETARKRRKNTEKWEQIKKSLMGNPDQWGLIGNFTLGVGTHIRRGKYGSLIPESITDVSERPAYMEKHWEVTTRRTGESNDVYIRWIGKGCSCVSCSQE